MNKELTEIVYVLDRSGSMSNLTKSAVKGYNDFVKEQKAVPGEVNFSLVLFDHEYDLVVDRLPIKKVKKLSRKTFEPRGTTALLDAIGRTVDDLGRKLAETPEELRPGSVIVAIYTDGYENASKDYSRKKIKEMIQHQTEKYNWDFLFLAANEDAIATATSYGIDGANASRVAYSDVGMSTATMSFSKKIKAKRMMSTGKGSEEDAYYASASMEEIVEEE